MSCNRSHIFVQAALLLAIFLPATLAFAAEKAAPAANAGKAKAEFQAKFDAYKAAVRDIEKLQSDYQSADEDTRKKLNETLTAQVAHAHTLVNEMVDAAKTVYQLEPNKDKKISDLLFTVAKYDTIGRQIGPAEASPHNPDDVYFPIDGGDHYERALPIIKLMVDKGYENNELYIWGFLCAFMTNDYPLAKTYLEKAKSTKALQAFQLVAERNDKSDSQAGLSQNALRLISVCTEKLDEYQDLWAKEQAIRAAEAKADNLPRVKLTTTKGEITLELFENEAPQTVANFLTLVKQGFYNGSPFHRVLPAFMAQGGAKSDDGQGGPGYTIRCECYRPDYRRHFRGTLSMAHAGRDTGNSQFFLTTVATPHLNGRHTAFGRVIEGIDVVADLQHRSTEHEQNPPKPDRIIKAEVIRDRGHEYKFEKLPDRS